MTPETRQVAGWGAVAIGMVVPAIAVVEACRRLLLGGASCCAHPIAARAFDWVDLGLIGLVLPLALLVTVRALRTFAPARPLMTLTMTIQGWIAALCAAAGASVWAYYLLTWRPAILVWYDRLEFAALFVMSLCCMGVARIVTSTRLSFRLPSAAVFGVAFIWSPAQPLLALVGVAIASIWWLSLGVSLLSPERTAVGAV